MVNFAYQYRNSIEDFYKHLDTKIRRDSPDNNRDSIRCDRVRSR